MNDAKKPDITLNFRSLINDLVADGRMSTDSADMLSLKTTTKEHLDWHPLERIAEEPIPDIKNPGDQLYIETLTAWLCEKSGHEYLRIDPLKVDIAVVTRVMSYEFAKRHQLLCVDVTDDWNRC